MFSILKYISLSSVIVLNLSCKGAQSPLPANDEQSFSEYWNRGQAEISTFELNQSRYGDQHDGTAVMIFVAEDFSKNKFVKVDAPLKHKSDAVRVLKLNINKEFVTGIYKYSMMSSVYTPVDYSRFPHSLKLSASSQDWCGQTFMQAKWKGNRYEVESMSYFESEGDKKYSLVNTWLEDELWTKIRVSPNTLPIGKIKMIASAFYIRLSHQENKAYDADASLVPFPDHYSYTIHYPILQRTLEIQFENSFPHRILGWKETYGQNEVTTGRLLKTVFSDYWNRNHPKDEVLRDSLFLH